MTGSPEVIASLQSLLAAEYNFNLQSRMDTKSLKFMGVKKVAGKFRDFGDRAHDFYQDITERLLDLGATPAVEAGSVSERPTVTLLFQNALLAANKLSSMGISGIQTAVRASDETTAEKLRHIEERHEKQIAWLERQLRLIKALGEMQYIAQKL